MTKALTLHQPWASLVALGVKTIETRSRSTDYRGPLLIHAGAKMTRAQRSIAYADPIGDALNAAGVMLGGDCAALPLGAVVASCTLADVVPMVELMPLDRASVLHIAFSGHLVLMGPDPTDTRTVDDQRPYGDFTPGRFAWLLEDVKATTERCPACWGDCRIFDDAPDGVREYRCLTCLGAGLCDPIPAKGHQRLWE